MSLNDNNNDQRIKLKPDDTEFTSKIGQLTMLFVKDEKHQNYTGTAILYVKLTSDMYVILTCAHNFIIFRTDGEERRAA
jgi:hypothetical protein